MQGIIKSSHPPTPIKRLNPLMPSSFLSFLLRLAGHNLDLLGLLLMPTLHLEINVLDYERPDLVAEAVCIEVTLAGN